MTNYFHLIRNFLLIIFLSFFWFTPTIYGQEEDLEYCIPEYTVPCITGIRIDYVGLEGENFNIVNASECSDNNYADYTANRGADLLPGGTYQLEVATDYVIYAASEVKVWIDYNSDGVFSDSEEIANTNGAGLEEDGSIFEFTVPDNLDPGDYRMRVRLVYAFSEFDACSDELHGETEDYNIEILELIECDEEISAGTPLENELDACPNTGFTIAVENATEAASGLLRIWQYRDNEDDEWENIENAFSSTYNVSGGIEQSTQFRYTVTCGNQTEVSDIIQVNLITGAECYCQPQYLTSCDFANGNRITKVVLQGESHLLHNETYCEEDNYGDYTYLQAPDLIPGESYIISISSDFHNPDVQQAKAWIDFNNNGSFEADEEILSTEGSGLNEGTRSFNFIIPEDANIGVFRMRVRVVNLDGNANFDSCSTQTFGETEDYSIEVIEVEECEGIVTAGSPLDNSFEICANTEFIISVSGSSDPAENLNRIWQSSPEDEENWTDISDATSSTYLMTEGVTENTKFRFMVNCSASDSSNISDEILVTVKPVEECFCLPFNNETDEYYISNVKTTDAIQNINNTTGFSEGGYGDYSQSHIIVATAGQEINFSISSLTSSNYRYNIWLDLNRNSEFDEDENIISSDGGVPNAFIANYSIPENLEPGDYRIRIRNAYSGSQLPACGESVNGEAEDYTLRIIEEPDCNAVSNIFSNLITSQSAEIYWEDDLNSNGWQFVYGEYGFNPETEGNIIDNVTENAYSLTGLNENTHYQIYIRAYCENDGNFSPYETHHFRTLCEATEIPYILDFEDSIPPEFPDCTSIANSGLGNDWELVIEGNFAFDSQALMYKNNPNEPGDAWFFTQGLNLETGVNYQISYKYGGRLPDYTEKMKVSYGNYAEPEEMSVILADHNNIIGPDAEYNTVIFTVNQDGIYYFGFNAYSDPNQRNLYLDDIEIDFGPSCPNPENISYSNLTDTSVKVNWENNNSPYWVVVYGETGFDPVSEEENRIIITGGIPEVVLTDLDPNTNYEIFVLSICEDNEGNEFEGNYENSLSITTTPQSPLNTEICNAFELIINQPCASEYSNDYAYEVEGEPFGSCLNAFHGTNSVWFKFTAPSSGIVTIKKFFETNNFVPELTVYEGLEDCEEWDGIQEVVCSDSNQQTDIYLEGLNPGEIYYIQITGFNDSSGEFCLEINSELSIDQHVLKDFCFYPNPVKNILKIENSFEIKSVHISNLLGQTVMSMDPNQLDYEFSVEHLTSGVYFMIIHVESGSKTFKLIKK